MPTFDTSRDGYANLWNRAKVQPEKRATVGHIAGKIIEQKVTYQKVERQTGVPWFMVGAIHNRESSLRFNAHLHNGDSLSRRTTHVPAGRPKGEPPFSWDESAEDALAMPPHSLNKIQEWSVERILYECERYNGWGYLGKGNSPYLWSHTTEYHGGKYVADHVYDPNAWDKQIGCAALFKMMAELDLSVAHVLTQRQYTPPRDIIPEDKEAEKRIKIGRRVRDATAGTGAATGTGKATVPTPDNPTGKLVMDTIIPIVIIAAIVGAAVAFIYVSRKRKKAAEAAKKAWLGTRSASTTGETK